MHGQKLKIFKRPKNREDGSDFDDCWTESIVSTQSIFSKIFERTKKLAISIDIDRLDRSVDQKKGKINKFDFFDMFWFVSSVEKLLIK